MFLKWAPAEEYDYAWGCWWSRLPTFWIIIQMDRAIDFLSWVYNVLESDAVPVTDLYT